jgi:acyl-CoA synthetase (NDP forming)
VPYFPSAERALRAVKRLHVLAEQGPVSPPPAIGPLGGLDDAGPVIPEASAKAILAQAGIPFPAGRLAETVEQAKAAAEALGFPVVLKIQSAAISHKSDVGGVVLNCGDAEAVAQGWERMMAAIGRINPAPRIDGVLVETMGKRGLELIVGGRNDPDWGPVVLVGFGGVQAEILQDVRLLAPDLSLQAIVQELHQLKQAPLLRGFRGAPAMDVEAVAAIARALAGVLAASPEVREIDLNPVVVYPKGEGAVALDALIHTGAAEPSAH